MMLLTATVSQPPRQVTTKYGDRTVIDVICEHREETIWRRGSDAIALALVPGQQISVTRDSKGKLGLVENLAPMPQETIPTPDYTASNGRSPEIKEYIGKLAKLYSYTHKAVGLEMADAIASSEDHRAIATTLFIQTVKHFDL